MALNKIILTKLAEKTKDDKPMQELLRDIFAYESSQKGWYKKQYAELIEKHCPDQEAKK